MLCNRLHQKVAALFLLHRQEFYTHTTSFFFSFSLLCSMGWLPGSLVPRPGRRDAPKALVSARRRRRSTAHWATTPSPAPYAGRRRSIQAARIQEETSTFASRSPRKATYHHHHHLISLAARLPRRAWHGLILQSCAPAACNYHGAHHVSHGFGHRVSWFTWKWRGQYGERKNWEPFSGLRSGPRGTAA